MVGILIGLAKSRAELPGNTLLTSRIHKHADFDLCLFLCSSSEGPWMYMFHHSVLPESLMWCLTLRGLGLSSRGCLSAHLLQLHSPENSSPPLCLLLSNISFCLPLILTTENVPVCCLHWIFEWVPTGQLVLLAFWPRLMRRREKDLDSGLQKLKPPHFSSPLINSLVYLPVTMTNDTTSWCYHIWQSHPGFELIN